MDDLYEKLGLFVFHFIKQNGRYPNAYEILNFNLYGNGF